MDLRDGRAGAGGAPLAPWDERKGEAPFAYPARLAHPRQISIDTSDGASDYGNKYGEPVVAGFCRSFGLRLAPAAADAPPPAPGAKTPAPVHPAGERVEWIKPIMFSAGLGQMDSRHAVKARRAAPPRLSRRPSRVERGLEARCRGSRASLPARRSAAGGSAAGRAVLSL